jgi:hypothetical protein
MSSCAHAGPFGAHHMSEGAIGTRSEELQDWVDSRMVSKVRFEDTKKMISIFNEQKRFSNIKNYEEVCKSLLNMIEEADENGVEFSF